MLFMNWLRQRFGTTDELSPTKIRNREDFKIFHGRSRIR